MAKTDRFYIKEYEEETNLKAYLLVDASGSMGYRGKHVSKFQYASILPPRGYLMLQQLDPVGLITHDTRGAEPEFPRANLQALLRTCKRWQTQPGRRNQHGAIMARAGWHRNLLTCFPDSPCAAASTAAIRLQVGFLFVFLDVEAVCFAIRSPVDVPDLVARVILLGSANSNAEPLYGLLCTPLRNPSTTVRGNHGQTTILGERAGVEANGSH